jgi:hypothetical protein
VPNPTIATRRLDASGLLATRLASPEAVVGWFGAVQSQDYPGASWGVGQRLPPGTTAPAINEAFDDGRILRTHAMRPTWHFVLPADIRWILGLTSRRVQRLNATYYRRTGLDAPTLAAAVDVIARSLEGARHLTRPELARALAAAGISTEGQRLSLLVMNAELEGVVCSGPRRGRQFTYALLDERAAPAPRRTREEALAELTHRYFASHGPAQPRDFAWWSGLTIADAKAGLDLAGPDLARESIDGADWWWAPAPDGEPALPAGGPLLHLLPNYDEYLGSYRDHAPTFDEAMLGERWVEEVFAAHLVVRDGMAIGGWKREIGRHEVIVRPDLLVDLDAAGRAALERATAGYGRFVGRPARLAEPGTASRRGPARAG